MAGLVLATITFVVAKAMGIKGIHGLLYSSDPDATRAFFKDKVKLPGSDVGDGWWIFDFAEGDLGVHGIEHGGTAGDHDVSFYCDDLAGTVKDMKARGVSFNGEIEDHGYGLVTHFTAPGGITVQLYEPRYQKGGSRPKKKKKAAKQAQKKAPTKKKTTTSKAQKKPVAKKPKKKK